MAWWATALFAVGGPGLMGLGLLGVWLAIADFPDALAVVLMGTMGLGIFGLGIVATYYVIAAFRGRPMLRVDARGILWGEDWNRDLGVEWPNVRRLRVRTVTANGIADTQIIPDLIDDRPVRERAKGFRQRGTVIGNRLYFGAPLGIPTVYVQGGYRAVMMAVMRHYHGPVETA